MASIDIDKFIGIPYNKENENCATLVARYYRELGLFDCEDGDLVEYTHTALLWLKKYFKPINKLKKHCLIVCKNTDGALHVAVFDGKRILHNTSSTGMSFRQSPALFFLENKNTRMYECRL